MDKPHLVWPLYHVVMFVHSSEKILISPQTNLVCVLTLGLGRLYYPSGDETERVLQCDHSPRHVLGHWMRFFRVLDSIWWLLLGSMGYEPMSPLEWSYNIRG